MGVSAYGTIESPVKCSNTSYYLIDLKLVKCLNRMDRRQFLVTSIFSLFHPQITNSKENEVKIKLFSIQILSESKDKILPMNWKNKDKIKIDEQCPR